MSKAGGSTDSLDNLFGCLAMLSVKKDKINWLGLNGISCVFSLCP